MCRTTDPHSNTTSYPPAPTSDRSTSTIDHASIATICRFGFAHFNVCAVATGELAIRGSNSTCRDLRGWPGHVAR